MWRTRAQIVAGLEAQGLRFRTFTIAERSPHAIGDWDWNQRDLPHIPFIHGGFRLVPGVAEDGLASGLYVQRILGVRIPLGVTFHHDPDHEGPALPRVYQAALGPLAVVIGAALAPIASGTLVTTTYSVGGLRGTRLLLPLAERILRRNAERLRREDEVILARRTRLRGWGYGFAADAEGASYRRSLDLDRDNVRLPAGAGAPGTERVQLDEGRREVLVGRDDHRGLRVLVDGGRAEVYPRMCAHEGASLDGCPAERGAIRCPWHGRRIPALATFALGQPAEQVREAPHHRLALAGRTLTVTPRAPAPEPGSG